VSKVRCIYHDDLDGRCAAFWVRYKYGMECECLKANYNIPSNEYLDKVEKDEKVVIVDFSLEPEDMDKLLAITDDVIWIDHHITSIDKYKGFHQRIPGMRIDGIAGCVLTYIYFNLLGDDIREQGPELQRENIEKYVSDVPKPTLLIGDRDVWDWKYGDETRFFFSGMESYDTNPMIGEQVHGSIWAMVLSPHMMCKVHSDGRIVERFKKYKNAELVDAFSFRCNWEGHKCVVVNAAKVGSEIFNSIDPDTYDMSITFIYDGEKFVISLYSMKIDVEKIAKKYGGGGHKGASGFDINELPFKKEK